MKKHRLLSLFLVGALFAPALLLLTVPASAANLKLGDTIEYGTWPQTQVTDAALIAELDKLNAESFYDRWFSAPVTNSFRFEDVTYGGVQYCRLRDNSDERYFKYEPLQWRLLNASNAGVLVITEKVIDAVNNPTNGSWGGTDAFDYLNETFYEAAFSAEERTGLTVLATHKLLRGSNGYYQSVDVDEYVTLPDVAFPFKLENGFSQTRYEDPRRIAYPTDYVCALWGKEQTNSPDRWYLRGGSGMSLQNGTYIMEAGQLMEGSGILSVPPLSVNTRFVIRLNRSLFGTIDPMPYGKQPVAVPSNIELEYKQTTDIFERADNEYFKWSSSNTSVATIDNNGKLVTTGRGSTTIKATNERTAVVYQVNVKIKYTTTQWLIVIFLFGWLWY